MKLLLCTAGLLVSRVANAEPTQLSLEDAIRYADDHHPVRRADAASERAAELDVAAERARYVPDVELFLEASRGTTNGVPGPVFAVPGLPNVAGPAERTFDGGHWSTAAGATATWDTLGFVTWNAAIDRARAEVRLARDEAAASQLELEYTAADRFVTVLGRAEAVKAAQAGVDRAQVFLTIVKATVGSDLRAGADLSRAEAELAFAQTALVRAQATLDIGRSELAEALGTPSLRATLAAGPLATLPPESPAPAPGKDPRRAAADDRAAVAKAERDVIATATRPKLQVVGALWGRGNGELTGGVSEAHGLVPDVPNWALGLVLTWPVLAGQAVDPQARAAEARIERERAREDAVALELASRGDRASVLVASAYRVAENTPVALRAARTAEQQITARYKAQLATVDDVAQVQRLLVQAETEDALARLDVWRALLFRAYAAGDLAPFLAVYRGAH